MPSKVELFVAAGVIGLLEYRYVIRAAFLQVGIFIGVHGVDLKAHILEIARGDLAGFADVFHGTFSATFAGENEHFLKPCLGDRCHLCFDLLSVELRATDFVVAVEATIDAVVLAVVRQIDGGEQIDVIAEETALFAACSLRHFFEEWLGCRGEERAEIARRERISIKCGAHIVFGEACGVVRGERLFNLKANGGVDLLHVGQIGEVVDLVLDLEHRYPFHRLMFCDLLAHSQPPVVSSLHMLIERHTQS